MAKGAIRFVLLDRVHFAFHEIRYTYERQTPDNKSSRRTKEKAFHARPPNREIVVMPTNTGVPQYVLIDTKCTAR